MIADYPQLPTRQLSPDDVLAVLNTTYVQDHWAFDDYDDLCERLLTFDTSVRAWRNRCELGGWKRIAKDLNELFNVDIELAQWKGTLRPFRKRQLRGVCELLATHATVPEVVPIVLFGRPCKAAVAFMALRELMARAKLTVDELRPSTELEPFLHDDMFLTQISKLTPLRLKLHAIQHEVTRRWCSAFAKSSLHTVFTLLIVWTGLAQLEWPVMLVELAVWAGLLVGALLAEQVYPSTYHLGEMRTFRDLSYALLDDSAALSAA